MKFNVSNSHWHDKKRRCPDCGLRKLLKSFYRHRSRPNGRTVYCKACTDIRTHAERRCSLKAITTRRVKRYWFRDSSLARSYLETFPSKNEAAKQSGVGIATIYSIYAGRQIQEATEEKILIAASRLAA